MSTTPIIADTQWDLIDRDRVAPAVDDVAVLEQTRCVDKNTGAQLSTFTANTYPSEAQAQTVIDQATDAILSRLPAAIPDAFYGRVKHAIALYSAVLIETSFYREQANQGVIQTYQALLDVVVQGVADVVGGERQGRRVDSVVQRGTEADYQPYYPLPAPRQIIEMPGTS